jgi:hypothetical protein
MTARRRALAPALAALLATLATLAAQAAEPVCAAVTVDADGGFVSRFPELLERIRGDLAARSDVDACARVALHANRADSIYVSVTLADGRTATRAAQRHEDVLPALQALLLVPQAPPPLEAPLPRKASVAPRLAVRPVAPGTPQRADDRATPLAPDVEQRTLGFELSLVGGPRMGEGQLALGLGALSFLEVHGWLIGFQGRVDRYQTLLDGDPEMALELAALAGRRLHFRHFALDLNAGPAVAMKGLAFENSDVAVADPEVTRPQPPPFPQDPSTGAVPRLVLSARAGFSPRSVLRSFAGIEASVGPARAEENPNSDASRFPIVTLGLVLGGTVGTR